MVRRDDVTESDKPWLERHFMEQVFPVVTPIAIDPAHPFPFIPNLGVSMVLQLRHRDTGESMRALVPLPNQIARFIRLPGPGAQFITLENLVSLFLDQLFPGFEVEAQGIFRVIRDSEVEIEEEAEDLMEVISSALERRRRGSVIRLTFSTRMPAELRAFVIGQLKVAGSDVFDVDGFLGLADIEGDHPRRASGPAVPAVHAALSRAHRELRRRLPSPRSGRRTSSSITLTRASTWCCGSCARPRAIRRWCRSSRRSIAPARTVPSSRR